MKVELSHTPNPDVRSGYWTPPVSPAKPVLVQVASFLQASVVCHQYIERNRLGGGNWSGGNIFDDKGKRIACVSYNGRVWDAKGKEIVVKP